MTSRICHKGLVWMALRSGRLRSFAQFAQAASEQRSDLLSANEALQATLKAVRWSLHVVLLLHGNGLTPVTSVPELGSPLPHLRRDWAHPCHICAGTGLTAATSAPGLGSPERLRIACQDRSALFTLGCTSAYTPCSGSAARTHARTHTRTFARKYTHTRARAHGRVLLRQIRSYMRPTQKRKGWTR